MSKQIKFANVVIFNTAAAIDKGIEDVARKGKTIDTLIHKTAVSCVYHTREHGDSRKMVALIAAMPKSSRRKALIAWVEAHMPCEVTDNKDGTSIELAKDRTPDQFMIEECAATPFWDFTVERVPVAMTVERAVAAFEKALTKALSEGNATEAEVEAMAGAVKGIMAANDANADAATAA